LKVLCGNEHQRDWVGEQFSELLLLEVAGIIANNDFFLISQDISIKN
jgi:hypothetical protein